MRCDEPYIKQGMDGSAPHPPPTTNLEVADGQTRWIPTDGQLAAVEENHASISMDRLGTLHSAGPPLAPDGDDLLRMRVHNQQSIGSEWGWLAMI